MAQGAVLAAAFREQLRLAGPGEAPPVAEPPFPPTEAALALARRPGLDLATDPVLPPPPEPAPAPRPAGPAALAVGRALAPVLRDAQAVTLASLRLTDARGVVVASTGADAGLSLAAWPEVARVLAGAPVSSSMRRREPVQPARAAVGRGVAPVRAAGVRGHAGVGLARRGRRGGAVTHAARRGRARCGASAGRWPRWACCWCAPGRCWRWRCRAGSRGRCAGWWRRRGVAAAGGEVAPLPRPGTREVAELSDALTRMAATLEGRARYVSAFAASVSHEFKTPLAALRGAAELLEDDGPEAPCRPPSAPACSA